MNEEERLAQLRKRITLVLADDEEFLEEIYLDVNFSLHEHQSFQGSRFEYVAYDVRFRLSEILEMLAHMEHESLVAFRMVKGFPTECGVATNMYRLTDLGASYCKALVTKGVMGIFQ